MAIRLLLILALILVVIWLLRRWHRPVAGTPAASTREGRVLRCAQCGLYVTQEEAVHGEDGRTFCCQEHRQSYEDG